MNSQQALSCSLTARLSSRRRFAQHLLACGTLTGLTAALPFEAFAQQQPRGQVSPLDLKTLPPTTTRELRMYRRATFQAVLSDYFQTTDGFGKPVSLLLLAINDLPQQLKQLAQPNVSAARAKELRESSFALTWRGPRQIALSQNTYKLKHPVLGELQIFLVPVGRVTAAAAWRDYEAVFNRMTE